MVSITGAVISGIAIFSMASNTDFAETKVDDSFLSDYIIASVEYPSDHENGKCTIHFASDHSDLHMQVNLKDGWRDGDGLILREDGSLSIKVHFTDGVLDGEVTKYDDNKHVVLKGCVSQGEETGLFIEYDENGNEVWSGYYRHGTRRVELKKSQELTDFYEERDSLGAVKNVSHFDPSRLCKDGLSFELASGKVSRVSEYRDGSLQRIAMEMKNDVLTEYDENGKKVYEGGYCGNMKTGFLREGKGTEYASDGETAVYIGEWRKGKRNGTGVEYKDGQVVFNGNWKDGRRVANKKTKKELPVVRKKKTSKSWTYLIWIIVIVVVIGVVIGIVALSGRSSDQATFSSCDELTSFPENKEAAIKELRFKKGCECKKEISLSRFVNCEKIEIESEALTRLYQIDISGISKLKELVVGDGSCESLNELIVKDTRFDQLSSIRIGSNALNGLTMVPFSSFGNVDSIVIGSSSLNYLLSVTLTSVDSLQSLTIGSSSLQRLRSFRMSHFTNLQSVRIGANALTSVKELELSELWELEGVDIAEGSLSGVERVVVRDANLRMLSAFGVGTCLSDKCLIVGKDSVLKNVKRFEIGENSLHRVDRVTVEGVVGLESLVIGANSVNGTGIDESVLEVMNCMSLKSISVGCNSMIHYKRLVLKGLDELESFSYDSGSFASMERVEFVNVSLRRLMIESESFGMVRELTISGMSELDGVVIGSNSFVWNGNNGIYRLVNCPKLKSIVIGDGSFTGYHSFALESLPSLQRVEIGEGCFDRVREWVLRELNGLERVVIGDRSFRMGENERNDGLLRIQNCSQLKSIECNDGSFEDYESIELNGLASLQSLVFGSNCFKFSSSLSLNGLNELRTIRFGSSSFAETESFSIGNSSLTLLNELSFGEGSLIGVHSLSIGSNSFNSLPSFPFYSLSQITSITIGSSSLNEMESFNINSFHSLNQLIIGSSSLNNLNAISFNSTSLNRLIIESNCLMQLKSIELNELNSVSVMSIGLNSMRGLESLRIGSVSRRILSSFGISTCSTNDCMIVNESIPFGNLKQLVILNGVMNQLNQFVVSGMSELNSIVIGDRSVRGVSSSSDSLFTISNCSNLKSIRIGTGSVVNYKRFVLNRLNKLESLSFGLNSLSSVERMELSSISLKQLAFGSNELGNTRELVISELNGLERVVIGDRSFRMGENERNDGLLRIQNCSQLKSIECNDGSFEDYESIELNGLASLQSLVFGSNCFKFSSSLSLNGLNELRTIRFGSSTFTQLASLPTNLLSQLTSLVIGSSALAQLQSLPLHLMTSLQSLSLGNNSLPQIHSLDISNLQSLRSFHTESNSLTAIESLRLGNNSFQTMKSFGLSPCSTGNCFSFSSQSVFGHIKTMEILSNSFTSFTSFDVTGALQLQTLMIGSSSFLGNPSTSSSFRISNCPTLTSLSVGSNSFLYYTSLALMNMTSLHSCSIGNAAFNSLARVEMRSVGLEVIELADHQFPNLDSFVLDGMDNLVGVTVGTGNAITTSDYSVFSVANCQSISTLVIGDGSFRNATDLSITSNPALTTIQMGDDVFHEVHHALFSGLPCVVLSPRLVLSP